jgi:PPP family 3-phenylpropionic acid transporter
MIMNRGIARLSGFFLVYFIYLGLGTFGSKYFAEIGLTESQIGILTSGPAIISMCFMPMWGAIFDRARVKKYVLVLVIILAGALLMGVDALTDFTKVDAATGRIAGEATRFLPLFGLLTLFAIFNQPVIPNSTSIAIEYARSVDKTFGPIRMMGTMGYQLGVLLVGMICAVSLRRLYTYQGIAMIFAGFIALTLPNVQGHQYGGKKISPLATLKDKRIRVLLAMIFVASWSTMFYQALFGAFLDSMGISNRISSMITWVSVVLEIPMLFFSSKLLRLRGVWGWMRIGFLVNGIRWIGFFAASRLGSWPLLLLAQIPAVTATACLEFFPQLYVGEIIAPELSSSAQSMINITIFGLGRVVGGLLGGFISQAIGLDTMYLALGMILLIATTVVWPMCGKMAREDAEIAKGERA